MRARIAAGGFGRAADRRDAGLEVREVARHGHPAVAEAGDAAQRRRAVAADPDRRMRALQRLGEERGVVEREEAAVKGDAVLASTALDQAEILVGARAALVEGHAEQVELLAQPAAGDAEQQAPVRRARRRVASALASAIG